MATDIKNTGLSKDFVKGVENRTIKSRIAEINQKLIGLYNSMKYFEKKYRMKTEDFYKNLHEAKRPRTNAMKIGMPIFFTPATLLNSRFS